MRGEGPIGLETDWTPSQVDFAIHGRTQSRASHIVALRQPNASPCHLAIGAGQQQAVGVFWLALVVRENEGFDKRQRHEDMQGGHLVCIYGMLLCIS